MPDITIPPWINIDPTAPVGRLLEGYRSGLAAAEAQNQAAARAQQQQLAAEQAAQLNAYREQRERELVQHWQDQLRFQQEKDKRAAAIAATQMEAQQGIQADLAAGMDWPKTLAKWAPKLFAGQPRGLAAAMQHVAGPAPPIFGKTPEGASYIQSPSGAAQLIPPRYSGGPLPPPVFGTSPEGIPYAQNPFTGGITPLHQPADQEQKITQAGRAELQNLGRQEARLYKEWGDITDEDAAKDPEAAKALDEMDRIQATRQSIYSGTWKPTGGTAPTGARGGQLTIEQAREFLRQAGGDKAKARQLAKDAGYTF